MEAGHASSLCYSLCLFGCLEMVAGIQCALDGALNVAACTFQWQVQFVQWFKGGAAGRGPPCWHARFLV